MPLIGVRELRERTSEVLRQVGEEKTESLTLTHLAETEL
jgi:antitoxin (DNA-binding transcriptional repressor) of toxin-antitoxin stability system